MTVALAPGLMGPAPPANAPPGTPSTSTSADPTGTFAALLTAAKQVMQGGDTGPPAGGAPPAPATTPDAAELLASLMALMRGQPPEDGATTQGLTADGSTALPSLDRLAEVGETKQDGADTPEAIEALEALMAYLVMAQHPKDQPAATPSLPDDVRALLQAAEAIIEDASTSAEPALDGVLTQGTQATLADADPALVDRSAAAIATANAATEDEPSGDEPAAILAAPLGADVPQAEVEASRPTAADADAGARPEATEVSVDTVEVERPAPTMTERPRTATATPTDAPDAALGASPMTAEAGRVEVPQAVRTVNAANTAALPAEVADVVQTAVMRGDSEVRLVLNPPELGHLDIRIATQDGGLRIIVEAAQSGARELLERSLPALQQALETRELRVERLEVRATDTGRGSLDTSGSGGQSSGGAEDGRDGQPDWSPVASFEPGQAGPVKPAATTTANGRVDVLA